MKGIYYEKWRKIHLCDSVEGNLSEWQLTMLNDF